MYFATNISLTVSKLATLLHNKYMSEEAYRSSQDFSPNPEYMALLNKFPTPNDWIVLGGQPRVFVPSNPKHVWKVVYVDDSRGQPEDRFSDGAIIEIPPPSRIQLREYKIPEIEVEYDEDDREIVVETGKNRVVVAPGFMVRAVRGSPSARHSRNTVKGGYDRITSQRQYKVYLDHLRAEGYDERVYSLGPNGYYFKRQPIRNPRPLN